jgi:hypothetical protein
MTANPRRTQLHVAPAPHSPATAQTPVAAASTTANPDRTNL